jgi:hypothetical protein
LERLSEQRKPRLACWIIRGIGQEHANAPHGFAVLRVTSERPSGR